MRINRQILNLKLLSIAGLVLLLTACGRIGDSGDPSRIDALPANGGGGNVGAPSTGDGVGALYEPTPLLWESKVKDGVLWSSFVYQIIGNAAAEQLLPGTDDMKDFCPTYDSATNPERVNFWGFLISAVAKYESGFNPLSRYQEGTMGTDPITKLPVYSEGLLQLSYQDIQGYSFCQFDWSKDKLLSPKDPKKTILDPFKNLECGIKILATQVKRAHKIGLSSGVYWSTLKLNGTYSKLPEIQAMTKKLPFCVKP